MNDSYQMLDIFINVLIKNICYYICDKQGRLAGFFSYCKKLTIKTISRYCF